MKKIKKEEFRNEDGSLKFYTEEMKKSKSINDDTIKIITFIIILIVVLGLLFLLFFLNGKYVTKDKYQGETTTTTTEAVYDDTKVTVNTMFNLSNDTYYVLAFDKSDKTEGDYYNNLTLYYHNDKIKLYSLDLNNAMNNNYYNTNKEQSLKNKNNINFVTNTLLIFKKGTISQAITDKDEITKILNEKN